MTTLSPLAVQQFFDNNSIEWVGAKLFTYLAGSVTKTPTYTDAGGGTPNSNPIILNSRGEANIWLSNNIAYKFALAPPTASDPPGSSAIWTVDNILAGGVSSFSGGTTGLTPNTPTSGAVALAGTLVVANGGTGTNAAGITAFNNITGYTAAGATGTTSTNLVFSTNGVLLTPTLTTPTMTGAAMDAASTVSDTGVMVAASIGFRGSPINTQNGNYSTVIGDNGKTIYHTSGSPHTYTINNAGGSYPDGAIIAFNNEDSAANITIALSSGTLRWGSLTGSRTVAPNGQAQAQKMPSGTVWRLTGSGIS